MDCTLIFVWPDWLPVRPKLNPGLTNDLLMDKNYLQAWSVLMCSSGILPGQRQSSQHYLERTLQKCLTYFHFSEPSEHSILETWLRGWLEYCSFKLHLSLKWQSRVWHSLSLIQHATFCLITPHFTGQMDFPFVWKTTIKSCPLCCLPLTRTCDN